MKPICVKCQRFYHPKRNGISFLEMMPEGKAQPGTAEPDKWHPYKLWLGDLWECLGCHNEIIVGVGQRQLVEHYQEDFNHHCSVYQPQIKVNDC